MAVLLLADHALQSFPPWAHPAVATHRAQPPAGSVKLPVAGTEPSACLAYPPLGPARGLTVFVDPGHGGPDPGVLPLAESADAVAEKEAALGVALALAARLRDHGFRVVMSRTKDTLVAQMGPGDLGPGGLSASAVRRDLLARVACANAAQAEVLLALHFNGFDDPSVGGTETFYDAARPFADRNRLLAEKVQAALVLQLGLQDRGIHADDELSVPTLTQDGAAYGHLVELGPAQPGWLDQPSAMPGVLTEPLFLTDPAEARLVQSAVGQAQVAGALAAGLEAYFGPAARPRAR